MGLVVDPPGSQFRALKNEDLQVHLSSILC